MLSRLSAMAIESHVRPPDKPKLLDEIRSFMRARRYSLRTEQAYLDWIRRFILFHGKKHPNDMAEEELTAFLTYLATHCHVAISTQNQHVKALLTCQERLAIEKCSTSMYFDRLATRAST
jgi:hypothetical protein